jgi:hypothetical protein
MVSLAIRRGGACRCAVFTTQNHTEPAAILPTLPSYPPPPPQSCRGLHSPHPPQPRSRHTVCRQLPPPLRPSPLALVLPCTTTSPRRRLPNGAISVAFREWTRCRVTRSIFRILAMEALSKAAALSITMARRCLYPRLPFPAGILRIPVFSVPVARNQDSCSAVTFFLPPQESCLYRAYVRSRRKLHRN